MFLLRKTFSNPMCILVFISLITIVSNLLGEDWPGWRGPNGNGEWRGPELNKELTGVGLERVWKKSLHPGYSGVTGSKGRIYTMDRPAVKEFGETERVLCLDADTGETLWEYTYKSVYGKLDYGKGPRSSLAISSNVVYGLGAMGHTFALDASTGRKIWFRDMLKEENCTLPYWGFSGTPEIIGSEVLLHLGSQNWGSVLALDVKSGKTLWGTGEDKNAGYAPPIQIKRGGSHQLICWGPNKIMGLPMRGGDEIWSIPYEVKYGVSIAKPIFEENIALVCGYWNGSRAIRINENTGKGSLLWSEGESLRGLMAQPLYRDGICYLLDRSQGLTAFVLATGKILWRDEHRLTLADRNPHASLVWINKTKGDALSLNAEGELVYLNLNPKGYLEYWREQVIGETWAHPAYINDRVYARDDRSTQCWRLPVKQ